MALRFEGDEEREKRASQFNKIRELAGKGYDWLTTPQPGTFGPEGNQEFPGRSTFRKLARMVVPDPRSNFEVGAAVLPYLGKMAPLLGFSKSDAGREIVNQLKKHPELTEELNTLFDVVKATPKKAIAHIKEFELEPGVFSTGGYHPDKLAIHSAEEIQTNWLGDMAASFGHEAGHGATIPMAQRILGRKLPKTPSTQAWIDSLLQDSYRFDPNPYEGVAEYINYHIQKKAGLKPLISFGHDVEGQMGQEKVYKELMEMPGKNPYLNAYRYLEKLLVPSHRLR